MSDPTVRATSRDDIAGLRHVLDATGLFPSDMLPEMIAGYLDDVEPSDLWMSCEIDGDVVGFCYAAPEELAEGTWNMRAIAVHTDHQGCGIGREIVTHLEADLSSKGHRVLIVDTSGGDDFSDTRRFYRNAGYVEEARIRDFWAEGDDKVVFWKALPSVT